MYLPSVQHDSGVRVVRRLEVLSGEGRGVRPTQQTSTLPRAAGLSDALSPTRDERAEGNRAQRRRRRVNRPPLTLLCPPSSGKTFNPPSLLDPPCSTILRKAFIKIPSPSHPTPSPYPSFRPSIPNRKIGHQKQRSNTCGVNIFFFSPKPPLRFKIFSNIHDLI